METITLAFKGKRVSQFDGGHGYSVPDLGSQHLVTPSAQLGARGHMWLTCKDAAVRKSRRVTALKLAGLDGYSVTESDAERLPETVTIRPIGNGYMAEVTIRIEV